MSNAQTPRDTEPTHDSSMSSGPRYSIIPARAVFDVEGLSATELRVLAALGTYTNDEGWCFPNQTTLAERLRLTRQTISGAIRKLVEKGYVETEVRTAKGRGKVGYNYRVVLDIKRNDAEPKAEAKKPDVGETRRRQQPTTVKPDVGADHDPMSAQASVPYKALTTPTERTQSISNEIDITFPEPSAYERAIAAKAAPKSKAVRKLVPYTKEFQTIWMAWPKNRRMNSDKRKAFERFLEGVELYGADKITRAAQRYLSLPDTRKDSWKFCCRVEVFMNGKLEAAVEAVDEPLPKQQPRNGIKPNPYIQRPRHA